MGDRLRSDLYSQSTTTLVRAQVIFNEPTISTLYKGAHDPLSKAIAEIHGAELKLVAVRNDVNRVQQFVKDLRVTLKILKTFGSKLPVIGQAVNVVLSAINNMQFLNTADEVTKKLEKAITKIQVDFLNKIKKNFNDANKSLEKLHKRLFALTKNLDKVVRMLKAVDFLAALAPNGATGDQAFRYPPGFIKLSSDAESQSKGIKTMFELTRDNITSAWKEVNRDTVSVFANQLASAVDKIQPIMKVLKPFGAVCTAISDVLRPVIKVLDKAQWLIDKLLSRPIKAILARTGMNNRIEELKQRISQAAGVDAIQKSIDERLGQLESLISTKLLSLVKFASESDPNSLLGLITTFELSIKDFSIDPVKAILSYLNQNAAYMASKLKEPTGAIFFKTAFEMPNALENQLKDSVATRGILKQILVATPSTLNRRVAAVQPALKEAMTVAEAQTDLDVYVNTLSSSTQSAPKLGFGYFDDQPIPILIRTIQQPIVDKQATARTRTFETVPAVVPSSYTPKKISPSDGKSAVFDDFASKDDDITGYVLEANRAMDGLIAAASVADIDFAAFDLDGRNFYGYVKGLLDGMGASLIAARANLDATKATWDIISPKTTIPNTISLDLSNGMQGLSSAQAQLIAFLPTKDETFGGVEASYNSLAAKVLEICDPVRFDRVFKSGTSGLSALSEAVHNHAGDVDEWFTMLKGPGALIFEHQGKLTGNKDELFKTITAVYTVALPALNMEIANIKSLPVKVRTAYVALREMQLDVQTFYTASAAMSAQCRELEAKAIAADLILRLTLNAKNHMLWLSTQVAKLSTLPAADPQVAVITAKLGTPSLNKMAEHMNALIKDLVSMDRVRKEMSSIKTQVSQRAASEHITAFENALVELVGVLQVRGKEEVGDVLNPEAYATKSNPLLDDQTGKLFEIILDAAQKVTDPSG